MNGPVLAALILNQIVISLINEVPPDFNFIRHEISLALKGKADDQLVETIFNIIQNWNPDTPVIDLAEGG